MKNTRIALLFISLLLLSCEDENVNPEIVKLDFPNCNLIESNIETSDGTSSNTYFKYEDQKLVRTDYFYDNLYNSTKLFQYDENESLAYMLSSDSTETETNIIASYIFEDGLLTRFTHYNSFPSDILSEQEFEYQNERLTKMKVIEQEGTFEFTVKTDKYGNPTELILFRENGQSPDFNFVVKNTYDQKFNPYYKLPDFIDIRYFSQNNQVTSVSYMDGVQQRESPIQDLGYFANGLLSKQIEEFSQGIHTINYVYDCE